MTAESYLAPLTRTAQHPRAVAEPATAHGRLIDVLGPTIPYGTPLRNVRCRVVGPAGNDCPDWVSGELWIGGDGVAAGYRAGPCSSASSKGLMQRLPGS